MHADLASHLRLLADLLDEELVTGKEKTAAQEGLKLNRALQAARRAVVYDAKSFTSNFDVRLSKNSADGHGGKSNLDGSFCKASPDGSSGKNCCDAGGCKNSLDGECGKSCFPSCCTSSFDGRFGKTISDMNLLKTPNVSQFTNTRKTSQESVSTAAAARLAYTRANSVKDPLYTSKTARRLSQELKELFHKMGSADDYLEADTFRGRVRRLLRDRRFEAFIAFLIVSNALLIGVQADMGIKQEPQHQAFMLCNLFFTIVFSSELLLRIIADGCAFFSSHNSDQGWNFFDSMIVIASLAEWIFYNVHNDAVAIDISALRLLRILRMVRVLRIMRVVRFFRDLRVMVMGIMCSMKPLFWAVSLLGMMMYLVAICFLEALSVSSLKHRPPREFTSLLRAMYTLYMSIFGGMDWHAVVEPLLALSPFLCLLFCLYVALAILCVLNIVTGVFVENANKVTRKDEEQVLMEDIEARKKRLNEVKALFERADVDGCGVLDVDTFQDFVNQPSVQSHFRLLGVEVDGYQAVGLFALLDFEGTGYVDCEAFAQGIDRLHGQARSLDMYRLERQYDMMNARLDAIHDSLFGESDDQGHRTGGANIERGVPEQGRRRSRKKSREAERTGLNLLECANAAPPPSSANYIASPFPVVPSAPDPDKAFDLPGFAATVDTTGTGDHLQVIDF